MVGAPQKVGPLKGKGTSQDIGFLKGGNYVSGYWVWAEETVFILAFVEIRRIETSIVLVGTNFEYLWRMSIEHICSKRYGFM